MNSRIATLHGKYLKLSRGKSELLTKIDEAEIAESVYNSNAIENSTLTLAETEKILLEEEIGREANLREVYEAKNLSLVMDYLRENENVDLNVDLIFKLHEIFIGNIDPHVAGRFRQKNEYVRIGNYIAASPQHIESKINDILENYFADTAVDFIEKIAQFHLDFELVHPFVDGNGRIGRTIINIQLAKLKFPQITIRSKDKDHYHLAFIVYQNARNTKKMTNIITLAILESLHKRLTYLQDLKIINLTDYARKNKKSVTALLNQARRQTLPAFRQRGVWKIGI